MHWPCGWCRRMTLKHLLVMVLERVANAYVVYLCPDCRACYEKF